MKYIPTLVFILAIGLGTGLTGCSGPAAETPPPTVTVYASPTCGCCGKWIEHLRAAGFEAEKVIVDNINAVKKEYGVTSELGSCHTSVVEGYVVEGHVPADVVWKLLEERPDVVGITVPDMPIGSPGMEVSGRPADRYDVLAFDRQGAVTVYARR